MNTARLACAAALALCACSTSSTNEPAETGVSTFVEAGTLAIGAAGGTVTSADGVVIVEVPANALATATVLHADPIASPAPGNVGQVYNLRPGGTTFAIPADIAFELPAAGLDAGEASGLTIATYADGGWSPIASSLVAGTAIVGKMSAFAPCALVPSGFGGGASSCGAGLACAAGTVCSFVDDAGAPTFCTCPRDAADAGSFYMCTNADAGKP